MERIMLDLMYELPQAKNVKKVVVNRSAVEGHAKPKLQFYKPSEIRDSVKKSENNKKSDPPTSSADAA
jgi:ATP-dependent protease Clp ATPase subunit